MAKEKEKKAMKPELEKPAQAEMFEGEEPQMPKAVAVPVWELGEFEDLVRRSETLAAIHNKLMPAPEFSSMPANYRVEANVAYIRKRFELDMPVFGLLVV